MTNSVVITGINGFVGGHLTAELEHRGHRVIGVGREDTCSLTDDYYQIDLADGFPESIVEADAVIHLAGLAAVGPSYDDPQTYINLNSAMLTHLCEHFLKQAKKPRIIAVSSGAIYDPHQPMPITERSAIGYTSPYAVSKVLNENQCCYYRNRGLECIVVRPFNHIGPGQMPGFIVPDLFEKISKAEKNGVVSVGNLDTKRDYTDVRDIVRAYAELALADTLGDNLYNVCSGKSYSGKEIFSLIQKALGRDDVTYKIDSTLVRPTDIMEIVGSATRLQSDTGWVSQIPIEKTIEDIALSLS